MPEPVDRIEWKDARGLKANDWNPNYVFRQELRLLELSIVKNGWLHPILIHETGLIIDGFHRWRLSLESKKLIEKYGYKIPCVTLQLSRPEAMLVTVRINRAKGTNAAVDLGKLVRSLVDEHGLAIKEIALQIGATIDEVELLVKENVFKALNVKEYAYGKAWDPR